jgi:hypothetical protein
VRAKQRVQQQRQRVVKAQHVLVAQRQQQRRLRQRRRVARWRARREQLECHGRAVSAPHGGAHCAKRPGSK